MLFTSIHFIAIFLPLVFGTYWLLIRSNASRLAVSFLALSSLVFYGWSDYRLLVVILFSILFNYYVGKRISIKKSAVMLVFGVSVNLTLLCYLKYVGLILYSVPELTLGAPTLPLVGVSFYTFQQIAWLADTKNRSISITFRDYCLFISFFPQLIAGPIVHHSEMMPQFSKLGGDSSRYLRRISTHLAVGVTLFVFGLFKKVVIADSCGEISSPIFMLASQGESVSTLQAWKAALAYTMQIYFDFSGYTDMALGLARIFGIRLPMNFWSPYKSRSIIEFWRTWHMTLSRFLRDYVYIPLGGNQKGSLRRYSNLVITMLVGGIWHGAAWSYLVWGGLHGLFLVVNHVWNKYARIKLYGLGWILTFMVVMHAWVLFKAGEFFPMDFETALTMFRAMYDSIPSATELYGRGNLHDCLLIGITMSIAFFAPNTLQLLAKYRPVLEKIPRINGATETHHLSQFFLWRPTRLWAFVTGLLFVFYLHIASRPDTYVEFIYFQF